MRWPPKKIQKSYPCAVHSSLKALPFPMPNLGKKEMIERIKNLHSALIAERDEELSRFTALIENQSFAERIKEGITLYPIEYINERYGTFEDLILDFKINPLQDVYQFSSNGRIELFSSNQPEKLEGIILQSKGDTLSIILKEQESPDWIKEGKLGLNALPDTRKTDLQLKTLERILAEDLRIVHQFYHPPKEETYGRELVEFDEMNPSQNEAISHILSANPFHIIHGPPGTGKTRTLVKAIIEATKLGKKVMVAAPSNAAVDHITRSLSVFTKSIVRVGNSFKIAADILPLTLKHQVQNDSYMDVVKRLKKQMETVRKKAFAYKRNFDKEAYAERKALRYELRELRKDIRKIESDISTVCLERAQLVTGTFTALNDKRLKGIEFDLICVDEAGQAVEPAIWSIAHFAPQLVLAGDPLQLPPTLFTREAEKLGLGVSLIEKGIELGIPTTLLNIQYRMNDSIMQFSNAAFYEHQLQSAPENADQVLPNDEWKAIEFIDTAGCGYDEINNEEGGISNVGEMELVQKRLAEIADSNFSIGIISPYRKQVNDLRELLEATSIYIQTIDSFQGQERDIILVSLVRSNTANQIGFLSDYRRMNVALTRAKRKLIVIGDSATLGNDRFYQDFLDYVEKEGSYRSGWEFME